MKKVAILITLFFAFTSCAYSQTFIIDENRFIGCDSFTAINCAIPTSDGGIFFGGYTTCNNDGDIPPTKSYHKNGEVMIGKLDPDRKLEWIKLYGGSSGEAAHSLYQTSDGGYAILAHTSSSDGDVSTPNFGSVDVWLLKVDAGGNLEWEKSFGSPYNETPISLQENEQRGFLIFGASNGAGNDIPFHYGSQFSFDWFLIKTDSLGNKQWAKTSGGVDNEGRTGNILVVDTSYYIVSGSNSTDTDCYDTSWFGTKNTQSNFHLLKLDTAGKVIWDRSYGGSESEWVEYALFDERDSTIVMIGPTSSTDYMVENPYDVTAWIVKTRLNGDTVWTGFTGGHFPDFYGSGSGGSIATICKSKYKGYITARAVLGSAIPGNQNIQVVAIDSMGIFQTQKVYGGIGSQANDGIRTIFPYKNGYVTAGQANNWNAFNEGRNTGNTSGQKGGGYISYIYYWPASVNDNSHENAGLKVYPNPAKEKVIVEIPELKTDGQLIILNSAGQVVYKAKVKRERTIVSTGGWTRGVYYIKYSVAEGHRASAAFLLE